MTSDFKNDFSWSPTKIKTFEACQRKYYFSYYYYWNGWTSHVKPDVNRVFLLKKLEPLSIVVGNITHEYISIKLRTLLQGNEDYKFNKKQLKEDITKKVSALFRKSAAKVQGKDYSTILKENYNPRTERYFLSNLGLIEHYHNLIPQDENELFAEEVIDNIYTCLVSLENLPIYKHIVDSLIQAKQSSLMYYIEKDGFGEFTLHNGIKAYAKPDLYFQLPSDKENKIIVIDWKTGSPPIWESDGQLTYQLKTYAYKIILENFKNPSEAPIIETYEVYLPSGDILGGVFNKDQFKDIIKSIEEDIDTFANLLVDKNIKTNQALNIDEFKKTANEITCNYCDYKEVCFD